MIRAQIASINPVQTAEAFRLMLALERGYTSTLTRTGSAVLLTASDGQAVLFTKAAA